MELKAVKVDRFLVEEAKRHGFQSPNQYFTYLYEFEGHRTKKDSDLSIEAYNKIMAFLEMERLELQILNKSLIQFLTRIEEMEGDLRLTDTQRTFLGKLMQANEKNGTWSYKGEE